MQLISEESLHRPEVVRWHRRIKERYMPGSAELVIILPCSAKKPYSSSKSHMLFEQSIKNAAGEKRYLISEVILTSPFGIVPRELEEAYPAAHYDAVVTGYWSREEKDIATELLKDYIEKVKKQNNSVQFLAYARGAYREICEESGIETMPVNEKEKLTSQDALKELENAIREKLKEKSEIKIDNQLLKEEKFRKIADFQFGMDAEKILFKNRITIRETRQQRILLRQIFDTETKEHLATVNPNTGFLSLTLAGGERLKELGKYYVKISFSPQELKTSNVLCPGIDDADEDIRPNDEVIVIYNDKLVGVGKSLLSGEELRRATKGLGVVLRHKA